MATPRRARSSSARTSSALGEPDYDSYIPSLLFHSTYHECVRALGALTVFMASTRDDAAVAAVHGAVESISSNLAKLFWTRTVGDVVDHPLDEGRLFGIPWPFASCLLEGDCDETNPSRTEVVEGR